MVSVKADLFTVDWLGRKSDKSFINDLGQLKEDIDMCGESGDFHTFVTDGPMFKRRINIFEKKKILKDEHCYLDISRFGIIDK